LTQTDTTVGFVSQNAEALARSKSRPLEKPFLKTFDSFRSFKRTGRIPAHFKQELRRAVKRTYVVKGQAIRIVATGAYHTLLRPYGWLYSTSANASGGRFKPGFALAQADCIIEDARGLFEDVPSNIYTISRTRKQRIR